MTTMVKKENVQRKWYVLDAAGKPLGRTAVTAARLLRGKHKVDFTPNVDCGDFVIIVNADKAILTGNKLRAESLLPDHTGWIGGLKEVKYRMLMEKRPDFAMELAVKGMLPKNVHRQNRSDPPAPVQGRRAQPRRTEARSLDFGLIRR